MSQLTKEFFEETVKNLVSREFLEERLTNKVKNLVTKDYFDEKAKNFATISHIEELARMVNNGFEDLQKRLDVTGRVTNLETEIGRIKGALHLN